MNSAPSVIFQRSQAGRDEIKQKSHGLTQSERLVLIMVDGVACHADIRTKLPVLTDERFARALRRLQEKELVLEVFMPVEGQSAEELEPELIDRFLRQDALDPVTIIVRDPEDELPLELSPVVHAQVEATAPVTSLVALTPSSAPVVSAIHDAPAIPVLNEKENPRPVVAMDAVHNALADSLAAEVRALQMKRIVRPDYAERELPAVLSSIPVKTKPRIEWHWGYGLIALGCMFILTFVIANLLR